MNAIELASSMGFSNVWLESDSQLVIAVSSLSPLFLGALEIGGKTISS